jgi:type II secretory pathway component PulF
MQDVSQTKRKKKSMFAFFGIGQAREYFIENFSMLVSSGMPVSVAIDSIAQEIQSVRMRRILQEMKYDIENGVSLWEALERSGLFKSHAISLIRLGEESGRLVENLKVVALEDYKNRELRSKLRSAMMYPAFVLGVTLLVGIGIAWFILPKLATVFAQLKIKLPLITKILIGFGVFLDQYGWYVVPTFFVFLSVFLYFLFVFHRTKFIGQSLLFYVPGIRQLMKEVEIARFGYLLGTLLEAGLSITQSLDSLSNATEFQRYRDLYRALKHSIEDGESFQKSFLAYRGSHVLIPVSIQQLVISGEQSGSLSSTLLKVGKNFESKADTSTKNLTVILEPILLVIVWLGVVAVALAVILPIYSLVGGLNTDPQAQTSPPVSASADASVSTVTSDTPADQSDPKISQSKQLRILPTDAGYVNVRENPTVKSKALTRVLSGVVFEYSEGRDGWFHITTSEGISGWVIARYVELIL